MSDKTETNLWLDDERPCPFVGSWQIAKNYDEAVAILSKYTVVRCFLDHDLAWEHYDGAVDQKQYTEKTGLDVVKWMATNNIWPTTAPIVHSHNPVGARSMANLLSDHYGCSPQSLLKPYTRFFR
jgi:hypothetical protein